MLKYLVLSFVFLMGCSQNNVETDQIMSADDALVSVPVFLQSTTPYPMSVREEVKGNNVYVECVISNFSFSERNKKLPNKKGTGYLQLYLNNQKIDNIYTAAFIVKGLPKGKHQIKLELVNNDGTPYGIEKEFDVTITN